MEKREKIPAPTIARLPAYFRCLAELHEENISIVSSEELAHRAAVKASQFRKDLSYFGEFGIQGLGYPVQHLLNRIASIIQLDQTHDVVLVGAGNLGSALANFPGFARWGFRIVYVYDESPAKIGRTVREVVVRDISELPRRLGVELGILAVPATAARATADLLVQSGVKALLNFTGATLGQPPQIVVRNVDISHELAILAYHLTSRTV
ncbi:MAG: redox-sensing transcriptional repressor Rex [Armatimonadetes bacterium]|nr:redox-sensing transcriptional repressor Rex [Armatimonadota bacterium]